MSTSAGTATTPRIDPSARIDPTSEVMPGAVIEQDVIVGPHCTIGPGTRLRARAVIVSHTTLGADNDVHPYAVLGGDPQDRAYDPDVPGSLIIGDANIIREHVTLHRSTGEQTPTRVGSGCYFMASSHAGHNAQIGDRVILANCATISGHAEIHDGAIISAHCGIHQFTRIGRGVMAQALSGAGMHAPPYTVLSGVNNVVGLNVVGLRRNPEITTQDRQDLKEAYRIVYRERGRRSLAQCVENITARSWAPAAQRFVDFVAATLRDEGPRARGLCGSGEHKRGHAPER